MADEHAGGIADPSLENRVGGRSVDARVHQQLDSLVKYVQARAELLETTRAGNRDPLVEWTEALVAVLMRGELATSPVQKDWDVAVGPQRVQVRYLANSEPRWVNEHRVESRPGVDWYALVVLERLLPSAVLAFPNGLTAICAALGKRHPDQDRVLQFGQASYETIMSDVSRFEQLGMRVWDLRVAVSEAQARGRDPEGR